MAAAEEVNRAATPRRVIIMRGFMRRSGTFWFLGTWLGLTALPLAVHADDKTDPLACPDLLAAQRIAAGTRPPPLREEPTPDAPITIESDEGEGGVKEGSVMRFRHDVVVRQGDRTVKAQELEYNNSDNSLKAEGDIQYEDPIVRASGAGGSYSAAGGASFRQAQFELRQRGARGTANLMEMTPEGLIRLDDVTFTTCPRDDSSWQLKADRIELDTRTRIGTGHGAEVDFQGVPILYLPWMSFPLGTERKSGFLFPTPGHSTRGGVQFALPYYWNIAPNADLTFEPTYYSRRGLDLTGETRFLSESTKTSLEYSYLPNDGVTNSNRNRFKLDNVTKLPYDLRFVVDAETVSDSHYFEDFAQGPEGTSVAFLERRAGLRFRDEHWNMSAEFQQFQTIDRDLAEEDRPYARLPRILVGADYGWGAEERLRYGFDSEIVNFDRDTGVTGWRVDANPGVSLDLGSPSMYLRPGVALRYTSYSLDNTTAGQPTSPSRTLPMESLDAGMVFERDSGSHGQRRLTLEPRLLYLHVPYRNQDNLPLFDTGVPDLNLVELFRTNRYVGADRVSDANQMSLGVTSRLFDTKSGAQFLAVTLGQTYYFTQPRVQLPDEPERNSNTSDFVGQIALTAYKKWNADLGIQWNPDQSRSERAQANIQFKPAGEQVLNLGYRFQRDLLNQYELSGAWPINKQWNAYARYVYSLLDDKAIERFAGFEYASCCWRMRFVGRKFVSTRTGQQDTGFYLQLELTGLASVGSAADAFFAGAIRGYERPDTKR
ncbi:MAG: LPS assembly protein LptD [Gammaproteobacteria bacterium]